MPENTTAPSDLASQYAAQVTTDLERNTEEQKRISSEIDALQEQLAVLQRDHAVLVTMQQALGLAPAAPATPEPAADPVAVPAPRKKSSASAGTKRARGKKAQAAPADAKAAKPAARKAPAAARKPDQPTLVDLVRGHLGELREPRSAAEVASALGESHPGRNIKTAVVRTTLEALVAKGQAQRTKQGTSVYYTAAAASAAPSAPQSAQPEAGERPEQTA
ncbi:hypothetical protein AB0L04_28395 [Streptomyces glaucescens]|uniref:hypothetical protein n=1 Tax=Streptomyces glaucescens TaxID=1907 RepID=UPI00344E28D9